MTTLDTARDILAGRWFVSTDKPAYRAEVTEAAQCAIDGDDTDLCIHIAEAAEFERTGRPWSHPDRASWSAAA